MANTFTNLSIDLQADQVLRGFQEVLMPIAAFSRNVSPERRDKGTVVKVPFYNDSASAQDFDGTYKAQDSTVTGKDVTINKRKYVSAAFRSDELKDYPQFTLEEIAMRRGQNLAKAVLQDVWSLIDNSNYGAAAFTGAASTFDSDDVADLEAVADAANWPSQMRSIVMSPTYWTALAKDNQVQGTIGIEASGVLQNSRLPRVHNFQPYKSNVIPANGENLVGFICHPDAILYASRVIEPDDPRQVMEFQEYADPETGFSIVFKKWYDPSTDTVQEVWEHNYGYVVGNAAALERMVSS